MACKERDLPTMGTVEKDVLLWPASGGGFTMCMIKFGTHRRIPSTYNLSLRARVLDHFKRVQAPRF